MRLKLFYIPIISALLVGAATAIYLSTRPPSIVGKWKCIHAGESINIEEFLPDGQLISHFEILGDYPRTGKNYSTWKLIDKERVATFNPAYGSIVNTFEVKGNQFRYGQGVWCDAVK